MDKPVPTSQRIAVKGLIHDAGKVLLLRERPDTDEGLKSARFGLPGGKIEVGEPWEVAFHREIQEETGLEVRIDRPIYVGQWCPNIKGTVTQIIGVFFLAIPVTKEVVLSTEHDEFHWVTAETWKSFEVMEPEDEVLSQYFAAA